MRFFLDQLARIYKADDPVDIHKRHRLQVHQNSPLELGIRRDGLQLKRCVHGKMFQYGSNKSAGDLFGTVHHKAWANFKERCLEYYSVDLQVWVCQQVSV